MVATRPLRGPTRGDHDVIVSPRRAVEMLGHRGTCMIDRVYGHLFDKDRQELRAGMSRRAREAQSAVRPFPELAPYTA